MKSRLLIECAPKRLVVLRLYVPMHGNDNTIFTESVCAGAIPNQFTFMVAP
jgi:hypothetical protein